MPMGMFRHYFYLAARPRWGDTAASASSFGEHLAAMTMDVEADWIRSTIKLGIQVRDKRLITPPRLFATEEKNGRGGRADLGLRRGFTMGSSRVQSMMVGPWVVACFEHSRPADRAQNEIKVVIVQRTDPDEWYHLEAEVMRRICQGE